VVGLQHLAERLEGLRRVYFRDDLDIEVEVVPLRHQVGRRDVLILVLVLPRRQRDARLVRAAVPRGTPRRH